MNAKAAEVITHDQATALVPMNNAGALLQLIERAATNPQVDIDKMERLMQMHERIVARDAEAAFNNAMTACQHETRAIATDASNPQTRSRYATYAKLDGVLRPIYTKHGFSISYDTTDAPREDYVRVVAYVSRGGHTRTYRADMPADGKGAKGGDVMTKTHAAGAAMSYGMRYLLKMIFNVAVGEDDTDGNAPGAGLTEEELDEWIKKIEATTTKDAAKAVWSDGVKVCKDRGDVPGSKRLKEALIAHGEFIDKAAK